MASFADLAFPPHPTPPLLALAASLGLGAVATETVVTSAADASAACAAAAAAAAVAPTDLASFPGGGGLRPAPPSLLASSSSASPTPGPCRTPVIATRLTLATADPAEAAAALGPGAPAASTFTLLALRPLSDRVLAQACSGSLAIDIIALDWTAGGSSGAGTSSGAPRLRPAAAKAAVGRGIAFEVPYGPLLGGDAGARRGVLAGAASLARATRGAGIVLSSSGGGSAPHLLRSPRDAASLLAVGAGLGRGAALAAVSSRPAALLERGRRRVAAGQAAAAAAVAAGGGGGVQAAGGGGGGERKREGG